MLRGGFVLKMRSFVKLLPAVIFSCFIIGDQACAVDSDPNNPSSLLLLFKATKSATPGPGNPQPQPDPPQTPPDPPAPKWWQPKPGTSWQWQLSGTIDTTVEAEMYDIDYETPDSVITALHSMGRTVICYMSMGSWEEYRSDAGQYPKRILGKTLSGWPDERWVNIREIDILAPLLEARMDIAAAKGCDGIEPDNIDGYSNDTGFPLTADDQLVFNRWLAEQAHGRGLSIGLKNDLDQVEDLEPYFDWAINEQCFYYHECDLLLPFIEAGKAVFGVEYDGNVSSFCPRANANDFDWLKKRVELDGWRQPCR